MDLKSVRDLRGLAFVLGCSAQQLGYFLYKISPSLQYKNFTISKKSGGVRSIRAPLKNLKFIQRAIAKALEPLVTFRPCVNGYVRNRDILRNAGAHVGHAHILNIDLKDFFHSINYGRVYGLLIKHPFNLQGKTAAAIAQACTVDNVLPQGHLPLPSYLI